jgi:hypothetical protein
MEDYLKSTRNPKLKLGKIVDKEPYFEADIMTRNNDWANKIDVDKDTRWMGSEQEGPGLESRDRGEIGFGSTPALLYLTRRERVCSIGFTGFWKA